MGHRLTRMNTDFEREEDEPVVCSKVLVVAGVSWNTMVYVDAFPRPVEQTIFAHRFHDTVGSSGAGKALNVGRLLPTALFGLVGDDRYGDVLVDYFADQPVRFLYRVDPAGTKHHVNLMNPNGERISIHVNSGTHDLPVDWSFLLDELASADFITLTAYNYTRSLLPIIREMEKPLWLDIQDYDGQNPHWDDYIASATVIQLSSTNFPGYRGWMEKMVGTGKEAVICTHGVEGATLLTAGGWLEVPAVLSANIVDTNGAGDSFFSGMLYGRAMGHDWLTSLRFGTLVARLTVESAELYSSALSPGRVHTDYEHYFENLNP